jgi:hypothetical protein
VAVCACVCSNCATVVKVTASHAQALAVLGLVQRGEVDIHPGADGSRGQFNFLEVSGGCCMRRP